MNCANHPDRERTAFCQNCGKPICPECTRTVGTAVFCEPCLAAKLAGSGGAYTGTSAGANYTASGPIPPPPIPPPIPGEPNPGLAALLGLIPGVGAMYNGQYAKGVVHLIVFAILVSLSNENGIFGLFVAGWVCYQVIEAHQTARARRDGTPLPNPFGLNDLGERLGFGKAWPGTAATGATGPQTSTSDTTPPPASPYTQPAGYPPPSGAGWSAPWDSYASPPIPPYGSPAYPVSPLDPALVPPPRNRFPSGAIWLIGFGCLFLIGNAGLFHGFRIHRLVPLFLIAFGVWLFVRKMTDTGASLADDGTPTYRYRLFCALRGSIWIILVGVLFGLDTLNILSWGHSWPVLIIAAGVMVIFRKLSYPPPGAYPYPNPYDPNPYGPPPASAPPPPDPGNSIVPSPTQHDQEGR